MGLAIMTLAMVITVMTGVTVVATEADSPDMRKHLKNIPLRVNTASSSQTFQLDSVRVNGGNHLC